MNSKTVATNKKARFDFFLEETFVAGLMLEGWEVKSLREGKLNIKEAYIKDIKGELWLVGARINPASYINQKDQSKDPPAAQQAVGLRVHTQWSQEVMLETLVAQVDSTQQKTHQGK